jgi:hypothetical protein
MSPRRLLVWCVSLGALIVVAAGVEGSAHFSGPRWVPDFHAGPIAAPPPSRPSATFATPPPASNPSKVHLPLGTILFWTAVALAVVLAVLFVMWWRRQAPRRRAPRPNEVDTPPAVAAEVGRPAEPEPDVPVIRSGLEEALLELERDVEPGDAVVRAWLGLQQTAEQSGVTRGRSETPTEFTSRILGRVFANDRAGNEAIATLLRLYLRTRFGDHPVTDADVTLVRRALRELVRTWDSSRVRPTRGGR